MQSMDITSTTPTGGLFSPAAARNSGLILDILRAHLPSSGSVLEVASGSGQHAVAATSALPSIQWQPSDPSDESLRSINAWRNATPLPNLYGPMLVDMLRPETWPKCQYDALVCINMIHISPWKATEGLMQLAGEALPQGGLLYLYGPYIEKGVELAPSNAAFDEDLRRRNAEWGLRDSRTVSEEARKNGLRFTRRVEMPSNNISLMFRRF